jgi:hypothetical protein
MSLVDVVDDNNKIIFYIPYVIYKTQKQKKILIIVFKVTAHVTI